MANEIYTSLTLKISHGQSRFELSARDKLKALDAGVTLSSGILTVGKTPVLIPFDGVPAPRIAAFRIVDALDGATIDLSLQQNASRPFARLIANERDEQSVFSMALLPIPEPYDDIYAIADAVGRRLEYLILQS